MLERHGQNKGVVMQRLGPFNVSAVGEMIINELLNVIKQFSISSTPI